MAAGVFDDELVEVEVPTSSGTTTVCRDEAPRSGLSLESLAKLKPAFLGDGTVTAAPAQPDAAQAMRASGGTQPGPAGLQSAGVERIADQLLKLDQALEPLYGEQ